MYQILINKSSNPVLIEVPIEPKEPDYGDCEMDASDEYPNTTGERLYKIRMDLWTQDMIRHNKAIQQAISDESKHIQFKDDENVILLLWGSSKITNYQKDNWRTNLKGQTFSIPEGYSVRFEYQVASVHHKDIWGTISEDYYNTLIDTKYPSELRKLAILIKI